MTLEKKNDNIQHRLGLTQEYAENASIVGLSDANSLQNN